MNNSVPVPDLTAAGTGVGGPDIHVANAGVCAVGTGGIAVQVSFGAPQAGNSPGSASTGSSVGMAGTTVHNGHDYRCDGDSESDSVEPQRQNRGIWYPRQRWRRGILNQNLEHASFKRHPE